MCSIVWRLGSTTGLDPNKLYAVRGGWAHPSPAACPAGHPLGPEQVLVGTLACRASGGLHRTWTCRRCDDTIYWPSVGERCNHTRGNWMMR